MKRVGKATIWAVFSVLLSAGANAVAPDAAPTHYQGIVDRNVFNLRPAPAQVNSAPQVQTEPAPKVTLDGYTTILGKKVTFLTVPPTKPGTPPQSLMLAEGQAQDEVEVTQIDEKAGVIKVINHGESQTLDFEHNGTKPVATAPAGSPASPVTVPPTPTPTPANGQPSSTLPNTMRAIRTLPTRSSAGPSGGGGTPMSQDQEMMIEAQRYKALQENDPMARILPATPHTHEIMKSFNQQAPQ